jgi:ABC-type uncharacterized transport system substrate-binding protein
LVLFFAIAKDVEIIVEQNRQASDEKYTQSAHAEAANVATHHYYSCIRDFSMAVWWTVYGLLVFHVSREDQSFLLLAFSIPYLVLVALWACLKERFYTQGTSI